MLDCRLDSPPSPIYSLGLALLRPPMSAACWSRVVYGPPQTMGPCVKPPWPTRSPYTKCFIVNAHWPSPLVSLSTQTTLSIAQAFLHSFTLSSSSIRPGQVPLSHFSLPTHIHLASAGRADHIPSPSCAWSVKRSRRPLEHITGIPEYWEDFISLSL
jgi:hypothetical protein